MQESSSKITTPATPSLPPEPEVPSIAIRPGKWWWPVLATIVAVWIAYQLRNVLTPFLLAFLVAYALDPLVDLLERVRVPRPLGAMVVFGGLTCLMVLGLLYGIGYFRDEFVEAGKQLPTQLEALAKKLEPWLWQQFRFRLPHNMKELFARYGANIREHLPDAARWASTVLFGTLSYAFVALSLLIVPVFAFYLLIDFDRIVERAGKLVPRRWRGPLFETFREIDVMVSGYVRGQVLAIVILSALYAAGLSIVGLRLAIPIGVLTGCLAFVPYLGFTLGLALAVSMALLDWHSGAFVLQVMAVMLGVQVLDGLFITPRVVGRSVGLGPVEVLLAMAAAGTLFGFIGVLLAVPIGATAKIVIRRLVEAYRHSEFFRRA
ncbi:MAG: AI-2E family transporter [Deltaproteobacteria bacterium]|nr:AI-2E family transporter [Deltaproteobacteria bacterium]